MQAPTHTYLIYTCVCVSVIKAFPFDQRSAGVKNNSAISVQQESPTHTHKKGVGDMV